MALSNARRVTLGGGLSLYIADFTHTVGAADQTLAINAGRVLWAHVAPQVTSEPVDHRGDLFSVSKSGQISTITLHAEAGITAGTLVVLVDNGG